MKALPALLCALGLTAFNTVAALQSPTSGSPSPSPVLVELFTSEGCSSCPPADALLEELDRSQPVPGARVIALSEHVDYWNHEGWNDPYSSALFTDRQREYDRRFGVDVYTPQIVIDGAAQCNGSDVRSATRALALARSRSKIDIRISRASLENPTTLRAHVEADPLPKSSHGHKANIYVVVALDRAESEVLGGENKGRHITHVAVAETVTRIGALEREKSFDADVQLKLKPATQPSDLRLVAFVQESDGRVLGISLLEVSKSGER